MNNSIYPCIWCNNNAKEMADFYCNTFPETKIVNENMFAILIEMFGLKLMLLNGGDIFKPNPSISFMYLTIEMSEVEILWGKLIEGGQSMMTLDSYPFSPKYGWVTDKYGVSWQLYTSGDENNIMQKIVPTLMFTGTQNGKAGLAADFYIALFPDSALRGVLRYTGEEGEVKGNILHGEFLIHGYLLMMMDSSIDHQFGFNEGVSLVVECDNQEEIDTYWEVLTSNGGEENRCGWLKDQFGVSWQIIPRELSKWIAASPAAQEALLKMKKLDLSILKNEANSI